MKTAIHLSHTVKIYDEELLFSAIRAQGPGGQNVNKSSTAIQLQFDVMSSSLPERIKRKLLRTSDRRINVSGLITIKAQRYRSQDLNKEDAISRLQTMIEKAMHQKKYRVATKPTKSSVQKRLTSKKVRGAKKALRRKVDY